MTGVAVLIPCLNDICIKSVRCKMHLGARRVGEGGQTWLWFRRGSEGSLTANVCMCAGKGGKNRRRGKNESEEKRELIFKEDGQEYAQVLRMLGNGRLEAYCIDGVKRLCHIRGKMRKKVWVNTGDIVLLGLREYQDEKADVILKYMADEARSLKQYGELPDNIRVNDTDALIDDDVDAEEDLVDFEDVDDI